MSRSGDRVGNREKFAIPDYVEQGVVVTDVAGGSPAEYAGFRPGDVIRKVNRKPVRSVRDLKKLYEEARGAIALLIQRADGALFLVLRKE